MSGTKTRKNAYCGLDNVAQSFHLVRLTDACLEKTYLRILVEKPY
jgi:hypothetical protein